MSTQAPEARLPRPGGIRAQLVWWLWPLTWPLLVAGGVLDLRTKPHAIPLEVSLIVAAYAMVGAVVAARQPGNAIGWLYLAVGLLGALQALAVPYATFSLVDRPGSLPGGLAMGWLTTWLRHIWTLVFLFVPLLFPTGRPLSPGWRQPSVPAQA